MAGVGMEMHIAVPVARVDVLPQRPALQPLPGLQPRQEAMDDVEVRLMVPHVIPMEPMADVVHRMGMSARPAIFANQSVKFYANRCMQ